MTEFISRSIIAITLAGLLGGAVYWHQEIWIHRVAQIALLVDIIWTGFQLTGVNWLILGIWLCTVWSFHQLNQVYQRHPSRVLLIIAITQISDILQYLGGRWLGQYSIGWISPRKTVEGYLVALFGLLGLSYVVKLSWCYQSRCQSNFIMIGILGALGGIMNSLIKRTLQIKHWSPILGTHGGCLDRTDSLVLTAIYLRYYQ